MSFKKTLAVTSVAATLALGIATSAQAERVKWKMQSAFPGNLAHLGESGVRFSKNLEDMSGGDLELKFFEPGALVPALECFDAASKGSVESCWTTPGYHAGKFPAVSFFTAVPFGPGIGEYLAWKLHGEGQTLREELYNANGLTALDSFCIGPETSGWFKEPVADLASLKGMKMRFFGLGAKVMTKIGVSTQLLAGADIYPALERGVIDATEFSMPDIDRNLGFHQIAKHNYFPGWHQQVSCSELLMNKEKWDALPENFKSMIETAALAQITYTYSDSEAKNPAAMQDNVKSFGVTNQRWSDDALATFEKAWQEVVAEESESDELFGKVSASYSAWRDEYRIWGEAQSLKSTYLE